MSLNIKSKSYTLRNENGGWLAQIVITEDGMIACLTDYGNLSNSWRSLGDKDFREFILRINEEYFADKMYAANTYLLYSEKFENACKRFAEKILPPLQKALKEDLIQNPNW